MSRWRVRLPVSRLLRNDSGQVVQTNVRLSPGSIIIIQHLYSALKSCKGYGGAGGFRLRLSEQVCFEVFFKGV